jgi:hypothetical protein
MKSGDGHVGENKQKGNGMLGVTCRTVIQKNKKREGN